MASDRNREALRYALLGLGGVALIRSVGSGSADEPDDDTGNGGGTGPETKDVELAVISTLTGGDHYTLQVNGEPSRVMDGSRNKAEDSDRIRLADEENGIWEINGMTGPGSGSEPYGDTYTYTATVPPTAGIEGFSAESLSNMTIQANGQELDVHSLPEPTDYGPDLPGGDIGGGAGYEDTFTSGDYTARSLGELESALGSASSGDVVFVPGGTTIDVTNVDDDDPIFVPSGVTLASDRGVNGSNGALFEDHGQSLQFMDVRGRLTGVQYAGPNLNTHMYEDDYTNNDGGWGVRLLDDGEMDNVDAAGFGQGIVVSAGRRNHVHHCHIHDAETWGTGYGVVCNGGGGRSDRIVIEYNHMHTCRHEVMRNSGSGYIVRYNVVDKDDFEDPDGSVMQQDIDDHGPGATHEVHHNTFRRTRGDYIFSWRRDVDPDTTIHHNWFYLPESDVYDPNVDIPSSNIYSNHYGTDEPSSDIGHPR